MTRLVVAVAALALTLTGCTSEQEKQMELEERAERVAAEARTHMDALAGEVGTDPEVTQDVLSPCVPGQDNSGLELIYSLAVQIESDAADRVLSDVAPRYEAEGWTVRQRGNNNDDIVFERDGIIMNARFSSDSARATVVGSGGCVT